MILRRWAENGLPCACARGWPKQEFSVTLPATIGGVLKQNLVILSRGRVLLSTDSSTLEGVRKRARIATPGQAGLPAEFKHINKRRKRNLPGFP